MLVNYDENAEIQVRTDASSVGLGACLSQMVNGQEHILAYASRALNGAESRYSTTEQECLAVVWALKKFRPYLYGRFSRVVTDHCALCWLMTRKEPAGRLSRWSITLQEHNFEIVYRSGKLHQNADTLSRNPPKSENLSVEEDLELLVLITEAVDFWSEQQRDPSLTN